MSSARTVSPLIVTQKPSRASLTHQDSVSSSEEDWEDTSPLPPPSPSHSASYPPTTAFTLTPQHPPSPTPVKKKKKKRKGSFLFRRKKKQRSQEPEEAQGVVNSDGGEDLVHFADVLEHPSLVHLKPAHSVERRLSIPAPVISRSLSDSQVHKAGLESDRLGGRGEGEAEKDCLVQVTLVSGHELAVRDRTGTSDPYVKFKCGLFKYRSMVVNRSLNPEWNEAFSFITRQLSAPLEVKVYDHDFGSIDDYMGGATVSLDCHAHGELRIVNVGLRDPNARETSLGYIRLFLLISEYTEEHGELDSTVPHSIHEWNSILTIHLLKGNKLPSMDTNGFSDPYCKFKLGRQKRRSKVVSRCLDPDWKEQFDMRMYRGELTTLHIEVWDWNLMQPDDFIGETCVELDTLTEEQTHDLTFPLSGDLPDYHNGTIHLLLTITGTTAQEVVDGGRSLSPYPRSAVEVVEKEMRDLMKKYVLSRSLNFHQLNDVGHVTVVIERVDGLTKTADVFAIAEVGNSQARTHTIYKTTSPQWNKAFHFDVKDIHSTLEVAVYSDKSKPELIGKIKVPLLRLENGLNKGYILKSKRCAEASQGVLYLKCELAYQPVRAALRTLKPRESKLMEREAPFQRKVLMHNIKRITALVNDLSSSMAIIRHICNWENKLHSTLALLLFIGVCVLLELWMVPLLLVGGLAVQYGLVYGRGHHRWQRLAKRQSSTASHESLDRSPLEVVGEEWSDLDDDLEEEGKGGKGGRNLRGKFRQIQGILLIVQNVLGEIADNGERLSNLFAWKVPFLCWLCIAILSLVTVVTYLIPLRYIILIWGVNKLTKKLRRPNYIPNSELVDLLSCSPTIHDLNQFRELPLRRPSAAVISRGRSYGGKPHPRSRSPQPRSRSQSNAHLKKVQVHQAS